MLGPSAQRVVDGLIAQAERDNLAEIQWAQLRNLRTGDTDREARAALVERLRLLPDAGAQRKFFEPVPTEADSDALIRWARRRSRVCLGILVRAAADPQRALAEAAEYCEGYGIAAPTPAANAAASGRGSIAACLRRVADWKWWKRRGRELTVRRQERAAILAGLVHRQAGAYCSDGAVEWRRESSARNAQMLLGLELVDDLGNRYPLADAVAASTANPELRRHELMTRVRGLEELATAGGMVGWFVTWTLPSRYHARLWSGGANPRYDRTLTPRDGQNELCAQWARARAWLHRRSVQWFGLRCVEPHHDGTPHWHLLLWCRPADVALLLKAIYLQAFSESPNEPGAARARLEFKRIDASKGSAAGYVAKYVSKNVDGAHVGNVAARDDDGQLALLSTDAATAAERIASWSRAWGIRQFQFFGLREARVGVWREFRRLREPLQLHLLEPARLAADGGAFADFVRHLQTVAVELVRDERSDVSMLTAYGERKPGRVLGLQADGGAQAVVTRERVWSIVRKGAEPAGTESAAPWTRVNNCTRPTPADPFHDPGPDPNPDPNPDWWADWFPDPA